MTRKTGYRTATTCLFLSMLEANPEEKIHLVALTGLRWNLLVSWLNEIDALRRSNLFPAVPSSELT